MLAALHGHVKAVVILLTVCEADVNMRDNVR
jgi:hypothetical protein